VSISARSTTSSSEWARCPCPCSTWKCGTGLPPRVHGGNRLSGVSSLFLQSLFESFDGAQQARAAGFRCGVLAPCMIEHVCGNVVSLFEKLDLDARTR